jgi:hypothetical protein
MDREDFFNNLRNEDTVQDELLRAQRQLGYEERVIKRVFAECGIKITGWGLMANLCRHETGKDKLNFDWFNTAFRRFPARLCGRRIPRLHELTLHDLCKPLGQNRLAKSVARALAKDAVEGEDNKYVFVFPVIRTSFCAHNLDYAVPGMSLSLRDPDGKLMLAVGPTKSLFQTIGKDWFEL